MLRCHVQNGFLLGLLGVSKVLLGLEAEIITQKHPFLQGEQQQNMQRKNMMFKFHVKLWRIYTQQIVVSEMFQLLLVDLGFRNSKALRHVQRHVGCLSKVSLSLPRVPCFCLASKNLPSRKKIAQHQASDFFHRDSPCGLLSKNPMAIWNLWISILKATNLEVYVVFEVLLHLKKMLPKLVTCAKMFNHKQEKEPQVKISRANRLGHFFLPPLFARNRSTNCWDLFADFAWLYFC